VAPESERAMYPLCTDVLRDQGKPYPRTCAECGLGPCKRKLTTPKPNEPTLTCSEVVERLRSECYTPDFLDESSSFDTRKAEQILHSWRERRVQELEEALREARLDHLKECTCVTCKRTEVALAKHSRLPHGADSASGSASPQGSSETRRSK
jgi:hypothetical protein